MGEFLYICDYLGVTPQDFFDEGIKAPQEIQQLRDLTRDMSEKDLRLLIDVARRMK